MDDVLSALLQLLVFSAPTVGYLLWKRGRARGGRRVMGLTMGRPSDFGWALLAAWLIAGLSFVATRFMPPEILAEATSANSITSVAAATAVVVRAASEEVLFRGLVQGVISARFGRMVGVWAQAGLFLLPHMLLLSMSLFLWPLLPVQFLAGLALGWLRSRHDSIFPSVLAHSAVNLLAGAIG